jgi:hypothetical protein
MVVHGEGVSSDKGHETGISIGTDTRPVLKLNMDKRGTSSTGVVEINKGTGTSTMVDKDSWSVVVRKRTRSPTTTVSSKETSAKLTILQTIQSSSN